MPKLPCVDCRNDDSTSSWCPVQPAAASAPMSSLSGSTHDLLSFNTDASEFQCSAPTPRTVAHTISAAPQVNTAAHDSRGAMGSLDQCSAWNKAQRMRESGNGLARAKQYSEAVQHYMLMLKLDECKRDSDILWNATTTQAVGTHAAIAYL